MMSPSDEKRIVAMVDSFTKTVARNFSRNLKRAKANREKHFSDEPIDYLLELLSHDDRYPSDHFVLYADELSCVVYSETLYKALCSLPEKQRKVLLFDFWYAWTDGEIADRMEVTTRTVYNLRQRAFKQSENFMSKEAQSHELTYDLIKRAVHGDQEAIEAYLLHYDAYINSLVMYDEVGPDGQLHSYIDEDMKIQVQMKIVDALQNKWRKLI